MRLSTKQLQFVRWVLIALTLVIAACAWIWEIRDGWAVLWLGLFILFGFPAAMVTLHLIERQASKAERS